MLLPQGAVSRRQQVVDLPTVAATGKCSAVARLLRRASERLLEAAIAAVEGNSLEATALEPCAAILDSLASGFLSDRGISHAGIVHGNDLCPKEHVAVLWRSLKNLPSAAELYDDEASDAFRALSMALGRSASIFREAPESVQDALLDASGMLRVAARMFKAPVDSSAEDRTDDWDLDSLLSGPNHLTIAEITSRVSRTSGDKQKSLLRSMARQFHPDRNAGREMEVLPLFLHVQNLREKSRW